MDNYLNNYRLQDLVKRAKEDNYILQMIEKEAETRGLDFRS